MNKEKIVILIITWIPVTTIVIGEISFFLAGGIPALASDVGVSGAWGLSIFIQFLYAMLSIIGFVIFLFLGKNQSLLKANKLAAILSAGIISASINIFGILHEGASVQFIIFSLAVVGAAVIVYSLIALTYNSLTISSNGCKKHADYHERYKP